VVGFAGGLFAIGGALIAIPLLTAGFSFTQHDSQGTAMVMVMVMAVASACVTLAIYVRKRLPNSGDGSRSKPLRSMGDKPSTWIRKRFGVYRMEAIPQLSEAALVSPGTPVSFVAHLPALAPRVPFNPLNHDRDERANRQAVSRMAIHLPLSAL
jgi:hypothetical protein